MFRRVPAAAFLLLPNHTTWQMSLAKLAEPPDDPWNAGYVAAACLLALAGLAVLILVRAAAPPGPARMMGILAAVVYGIIVSARCLTALLLCNGCDRFSLVARRPAGACRG
jgi:hypothetical protein